MLNSRVRLAKALDDNAIPLGAEGICTADLPADDHDVFAVWFDEPFGGQNWWAFRPNAMRERFEEVV